MRLTFPIFAAKFPKEILPKTTVKVFRRQEPNSEQTVKKNNATNNFKRGKEFRENPLKIQMLSKSLYEQIFKQNHGTDDAIDLETIER